MVHQAHIDNLVYILRGSAATRFGCGEIFDDSFIANFPSVPIKEL